MPNDRDDAPAASTPQPDGLWLDGQQQDQIEHAKYWLRAYEQEYGAHIALGDSRDGALSAVLGGLWHSLDKMVGIIDSLRGDQ